MLPDTWPTGGRIHYPSRTVTPLFTTLFTFILHWVAPILLKKGTTPYKKVSFRYSSLSGTFVFELWHVKLLTQVSNNSSFWYLFNIKIRLRFMNSGFKLKQSSQKINQALSYRQSVQCKRKNMWTQNGVIAPK